MPQQLQRPYSLARPSAPLRRLAHTAATSVAREGGSDEPAAGTEAAGALPPQWEQQRQRVLAFAVQHSRVPRCAGSAQQALAEGERPLGRWCAEQRRRREGSKGPPMSPAEAAALEAIPGWVWGARPQVRMPWRKWLEQMAAFTAQHGRLPRVRGGELLLPSERELGRWCDNQRQRRKGNRAPALSAAEVAALEAVPGWWWDGSELWERHRQAVTAFAAEHGRLPRPKPGKQEPLLSGERELGIWCDNQRQRRKGNHGLALSAAQVAALEGVPGWWWDGSELWERQRQVVAAFAAQHGRLPRTKGGKQEPLLPGERELGKWCSNQRQRNKGNRGPALSSAEVAALETIQGWCW